MHRKTAVILASMMVGAFACVLTGVLTRQWRAAAIGGLSSALFCSLRRLVQESRGERNTFDPVDSETTFWHGLQQLLSERHPELTVEFPSPYDGPVPDMVVSNDRTGAALGVELQVGRRAEYIPLSLLASVRRVQKRLHSGLPQPGDVVVITTGRIPWQVTDVFDKDGIEYHQVSSPEEAVERLDPRLQRL